MLVMLTKFWARLLKFSGLLALSKSAAPQKVCRERERETSQNGIIEHESRKGKGKQKRKEKPCARVTQSEKPLDA